MPIMIVPGVDKRPCRHRNRHRLWTTRGHEDVYLCRMTDKHLIATYGFLLRRLDHEVVSWGAIASAYAFIADHPDTMAAYYLESEIEAMLDDPGLQYEEIILDLDEELRRRRIEVTR